MKAEKSERGKKYSGNEKKKPRRPNNLPNIIRPPIPLPPPQVFLPHLRPFLSNLRPSYQNPHLPPPPYLPHIRLLFHHLTLTFPHLRLHLSSPTSDSSSPTWACSSPTSASASSSPPPSPHSLYPHLSLLFPHLREVVDTLAAFEHVRLCGGEVAAAAGPALELLARRYLKEHDTAASYTKASHTSRTHGCSQIKNH